MRLPPSAPLFFAARRMRARPGSFVAVAAAIAVAGGVIGWSSISAAASEEDSVGERIGGLGPLQRAIRVTYFTVPPEADLRAQPVAAAVEEFADVTKPPQRVRLSHSIEPGDPLGTRIVQADDASATVLLERGRLPDRCGARLCEALLLAGKPRVGTRLRLAPHLTALVVGSGALRPGLIADPSDLGETALLVRSPSARLAALLRKHGSTVVTVAELDPRRVHGYNLDSLRERLRVASARLELGDPLVRVSAPVGTLADLSHRSRISRERLLIVAGESAALVVAFAAFVAAGRRREVELVDAQLTTLGASRGQALVARVTEVVAPGILGVALALGGTWLAAALVGRGRGLPHAFAASALSPGTIATIAGVGVAAAGLLAVSIAPHSRRRLGAFEAAAIVALGLIVWQTSATGALDPDRVAHGGAAPVILLAPALAFIVVALVLLRLVPFAFRLGERVTRRSPLARLTFVTAGRTPGYAAATTTFLAVALGTALFSFNYRATIDEQARDQARFSVAANWRVRSVALPDRRLAPVLRLDGAVQTTLPQGEETSVRVLALPAATVPRSLGWRNGFSDLARTEIAHRLRPNRVRLSGPQIATDATALRVWARARTDFPRGIVLHFLLPNQRFEQLTLGIVLPGRKWQLLRAPVSASLRGARLVVLDYEATQVPISFKYDPEGSIDLGPIEERRGGGWAALPTIGGWTPTTSPDGTSGVLFPKQFSRAPVRRGVRFEVNGTRLPLVHAPSGLPDPLSGFQSGPVPALAGGPVAAQAVDRLVTLVVAGKLVPLSIVGRADLFPSVVDRPHDFVVVDYDTLFAALNADQPGIVTPTEAWSFQQQRPTEATLGVTSLERQLRNDPLAAGTRSVLVVAGVIAVVLAFVGLLLATRTMLSSERLVFAEYEALGIAPTLLRRTAQLRVVVLSALGLLGGVLGGLASVRLVGAFVAVTGSASRPLPPIVATVAWAAAAVVLVALLVAVVVSVGVVAGRSLRLPAARRLRA